MTIVIGRQVEASTATAESLFAGISFLVPDFQRDYSWTVQQEVEAFWNDLLQALNEREDHYLGLVILTENTERYEVVDGQQRLVTLSLLANALRLAAISRDRKLIADVIQDTFLYSIDFQTENRIPRLALTDVDDAEAFTSLISAPTPTLVPRAGQSRLIPAHNFLLDRVEDDLLASENAALRLGNWATLINKRLTFTVFTHPDRAAAFRVFEVVNTRGRALTPAQLIKSYLINYSQQREVTIERWRNIEEQFSDLQADDQLTTFVRHVVELRRGYVVPRELYKEVSKTYQGSQGVDVLLTELETHLPTYLQMVDPTVDIESTEFKTRVFRLLDQLSAARFRPIFMAAAATGDEDLLERALAVVAPGLLGGKFGTGGIEAQFARAARRIHQEETTWDEEIRSLADLRPERDEFEMRLRRGVSKAHAQVLRSAILQNSNAPDVSGHAHQVRPRNGTAWPEFDDEDYKQVGGNLANWLLLETERRPQGSRTPDEVRTKLLPLALDNEIAPSDLSTWNAERVKAETADLARRCGDIWYDAN